MQSLLQRSDLALCNCFTFHSWNASVKSSCIPAFLSSVLKADTMQTEHEQWMYSYKLLFQVGLRLLLKLPETPNFPLLRRRDFKLLVKHGAGLFPCILECFGFLQPLSFFLLQSKACVYLSCSERRTDAGKCRRFNIFYLPLKVRSLF